MFIVNWNFDAIFKKYPPLQKMNKGHWYNFKTKLFDEVLDKVIRLFPLPLETYTMLISSGQWNAFF